MSPTTLNNPFIVTVPPKVLSDSTIRFPVCMFPVNVKFCTPLMLLADRLPVTATFCNTFKFPVNVVAAIPKVTILATPPELILTAPELAILKLLVPLLTLKVFVKLDTERILLDAIVTFPRILALPVIFRFPPMLALALPVILPVTNTPLLATKNTLGTPPTLSVVFPL